MDRLLDTTGSIDDMETLTLPTLDELSATINAEHALVYESAVGMLNHAIRCGEALIVAREGVPDGEWAAWIALNLDVSFTAAMRYVRIATHRELLSTVDVRPTSIAAALTYLREVGVPARTENRNGQRPTFDVEEAVRLHLAGMGCTEIGSLLGASKSTIRRYVIAGEKNQDARRKKRNLARRNAEREALADKERSAAVARVGGKPADAYAMLRRTAIVLDRAMGEAEPVIAEQLREALRSVHRAEDAIVQALSISRRDT